MSLFTIPSSANVVTQSSHLSDPMSPDRVPFDLTPRPGRLEYLYPGALPVRTNAPVGQRFCCRCGQWRSETGLRSANDICAPCRWTPYSRRHTGCAQSNEARDAQV